jgi:hypothetical protein
LVHGWPDAPRGWREMARHLHLGGWRTITPYLRAAAQRVSCRRTLPASGTRWDWPRDIVDLADGLGLGPLPKLAMTGRPGPPIPWRCCSPRVAAAGAGIGLSSVAATGLGTDVDPLWRGTASGIINTAAQLGTALGIAVLLLVAATTTGTPAPGVPVPAVAWALGAALGLLGSAAFTVWGNRPAMHVEQAQPGGASGPILHP